MKSYYELLGIDKTSDAGQIKRAYFTLVRKYTPEKYPEEFKELREAYETLSDAEKRAEYDMADGLPENAKILFNEAKQAQLEGRNHDASETLRMLVEQYPELDEMRAELARSYGDEDKPGKAITVWETLCRKNPENAEYTIELADAYKYRGWRKKAMAMYERATELEPENALTWMGIMNCLGEADEFDKIGEVCKKAAKAVRGDGIGDIHLYVLCFITSVEMESDGDMSSAREYLENIISAVRMYTEIDSEDLELAFGMILAAIRSNKNAELLPYMREFIELLPELDGDIREAFEAFEMECELETLESVGFAGLFSELFETLREDCGCNECKNNIIAMECSILADIEGYRPMIERLREEYPHLYAMHAAFFDEVSLSSATGWMLTRRLKILDRKNLDPVLVPANGKLTETQKPETYRREGPKIGRNDPCPCGSGKKYKKCCGA